jgi:NitT/TauT family transport system substrate-binding protein
MGVVGRAAAASPPAVRLGLLQFGTVQWVADVIQRHGLDAAHGFALATAPLANTDAGRIALMAGSADVVVSDWLFAASQRAAGTALCFAPFSSSNGGVMVRADSAATSLADLAGKRLGVAGGPTDKSWIVVQAAARKQGLDLAAAARVNYAAPPLLEAKLGQGELDAVLTYWNFAARLEAQGGREIVSVAECERALGLPGDTAMVGYVFREDWAAANRAALDGFLAASHDAEALLIASGAEWRAVRPLMKAPGEALFDALRARFAAGVVPADATAAQERDAGRLLAVLNETGGARATDGLAALPAGLYWRAGNAA